ncbi:MAG: hypothetical protein RR386_03770 [Bacteroidaceae bacterium]
MKKTFILGALVICSFITFTLTSCGGFSPTVVVEKFAAEIVKPDLTKAISFCDVKEGYTNMNMTELGKWFQDGQTIKDIKVEKEEINENGETAIVTTTFTIEDAEKNVKKQPLQLLLVKVNGIWKIKML